MKPTTVADEMFPEGPPYTDVDVEDVGETTVFPDNMSQVHVEFYKGLFKSVDVFNSEPSLSKGFVYNAAICVTRS